MMSNACYKDESSIGNSTVSAHAPMERRLTSILAADMAEYSRWMALDEEGVIRRLRWVRSEIIDPTLTQNGGRIIRIMGDGLLVEFISPVAAVRTAISIQKALARLPVGNHNEHQVRYRIGVNLGDAVVDGDDLLGGCVNVAARLEAMAPIGGICLSRAVHDQVCGCIGNSMTSLGARCLKHIPEPVEVWRVDLDSVVAPCDIRDDE